MKVEILSPHAEYTITALHNHDLNSHMLSESSEPEIVQATRPTFMPAIPASPVILALAPSTLTTSIGQLFDLPIVVQAGSQSVDGASAYLNFDPAFLEVFSITPGSALPLELENSFNNTTGQLNFSAGTFADIPSGSFTLATVTFQAHAPTEETAIEFNLTSPRQSNVTSGGVSLLSDYSNAIVTIEQIPTAVTLDGLNSTPPLASWLYLLAPLGVIGLVGVWRTLKKQVAIK